MAFLPQWRWKQGKWLFLSASPSSFHLGNKNTWKNFLTEALSHSYEFKESRMLHSERNLGSLWLSLKELRKCLFTNDSDCSHENKMLAPWKKSYDKPRHSIEKQRHHFANNGLSSPSYGFSSSHVWMWELYHKEGRRIDVSNLVLDKTLESPLDSKEIKPVNPNRNQPWIFKGQTTAEAKAPIFCPLAVKTNSLEKTLMLGKTERRRGQQRMRWLDSITN